MRKHAIPEGYLFSIPQILNRGLLAFDNDRRVYGRGLAFVREHQAKSPIYFVDQEKLRQLGKRLARWGGSSHLNEVFGDLIDERVCVGDAWNGRGFFR